MTPDELEEYLTVKLGDHIVETRFEYDTFTVTVDREGYVPVIELCRDDPRLDFDMFDSSFGVDERENGFAVVNVLYSTAHRHRILVRHLCEGGRDNPTIPSVTHLYEGANFMERETFDMFGIEFEGHPRLEPRILTVENFEGWPLRKDFYLASREAKPWPGVKEPAELDEEGNVIVKVPGPGDAPGPTALDEAMAAQAKAANPEPEVEEVAVDPDEQTEVSETPAEVPAQASEPAGSEPVPDTAEGEPAAKDSTARDRADEARKAAAEARAKKAEERAEQAAAGDSGGDGGDDDVQPIPSADETAGEEDA